MVTFAAFRAGFVLLLGASLPGCASDGTTDVIVLPPLAQVANSRHHRE
jgi:hypothetical protein